MAKLRSILSDGPEHLKRSLRRESLRRQLNAEKNKLVVLLGKLGERAWRLRTSACASSEAAGKLKTLERKRDKTTADIVKLITRLEKDLEESSEKAIREESELKQLSSESANLERQLSIRSEELQALEQRLNEARERRDSLNDDLDFCISQLRALKESTDEHGAARKTELEISKESIERRLSQVNLEAAKTEKLVSEAAEKLPPIRDKLQAVRSLLEGLISRLSEKRRQMPAWDRQLRQLRRQLEQASAPFAEERAELCVQLGKDLVSNRAEEPELAPIYAAINLSKSTVQNLENDIESDTILLGLLDPDSVGIFFGLLVAAGITALFLAALIVVLCLAFL